MNLQFLDVMVVTWLDNIPFWIAILVVIALVMFSIVIILKLIDMKRVPRKTVIPSPEENKTAPADQKTETENTLKFSHLEPVPDDHPDEKDTKEP